MAKAKDLAALAGLAGLAYAMRNKDKGMTPEENDTLANANRVSKMSDDQDALVRGYNNMSPGQSAVDDTNAGVLNTITRPKAVEDTSADNTTANAYKSGIMAGVSPKSVAKPASKPAVKLAAKRMSDAQNDMLANAGKSAIASQNLRNENYGNEGSRLKSAPKVSTNYSPNATDEEKMANRQAIADAFMSVPRAIGDYASTIKSPREYRESQGMKKGGSVKKMASGGMTSSASKRADGIATKGKTRGRIC